MAKAKKLPSGQWRTLAYSHTEIINGKPKRKYESFTADTKVESEMLARRFVLNKESGTTPKITVGEAIERYIRSKEKVLSPSTIKGYMSLYNNHYKNLKPIHIDRLTSELIQKEISEEAEQSSPKSVANIHALLTASLQMFAPEKQFRVSLPKRIVKPHYIPTDEDIKTFLKTIEGMELEKAVLLAAFGSLRRSEISPLTDKDIDFEHNTITVSKAMVQDKNGAWVVKQPKTDAGRRIIVLPSFVIEKFANKKGRLIDYTPQKITDTFTDAVKLSNLEHFRFHDLRHYQASILHALNVPDKYIMKRGGWASNTVMKNVYQHTLSDKEKEFTEILIDHFEKMQHEMQHANKEMQ